LLRQVLEGRMEGNWPRGRPRIGILDELMEGKTYSALKRRAMDRGKWRVGCQGPGNRHNIRERQSPIDKLVQ